MPVFAAAATIFACSQPPDVRDFSSIRDEWEVVAIGFVTEGRLEPGKESPKRVPPLTGEERAAADRRLAKQCLQLADQQSDTQEGLAALYLAASRAPKLDAGKLAMRKLSERIRSIDLHDLDRAILKSRVRRTGVFEKIAPIVIERVEQAPDHPRAAALLTAICSKLGFDSQTERPPKHFTEAADLIAEHCADSPDIFNFCEVLGSLNGSPHWAGAFEDHLETILKVNQNRWVRCTATLARASISELSFARQTEAEERYVQFLAEFDGKKEGRFQRVEQAVNSNAKRRLAAMRYAPVGQPAPDILGVDLDGQPMKLSDYRGKVVLVSFWATWCGPCMKLIPHERELAKRLSGKPFAIVGVNGNTTKKSIQYALKTYEITWRSFKDERPGNSSISDTWNAVYPTVFLIDHKGVFRKRWSGEPPIDVLNRLVDELVAEAVADVD